VIHHALQITPCKSRPARGATGKQGVMNHAPTDRAIIGFGGSASPSHPRHDAMHEQGVISRA